MRLARAHIHPNISLASGFLPGRPLQMIKSDASRTPLRPCLLYPYASQRSNQPPHCWRQRLVQRQRRPAYSRQDAHEQPSVPQPSVPQPSVPQPHRLVTVTAPTVRLPRRTMAKRPCSKSPGVNTALGSWTRVLFR